MEYQEWLAIVMTLSCDDNVEIVDMAFIEKLYQLHYTPREAVDRYKVYNDT